MKEIHQRKYCPHCRKETDHKVSEGALDIESICMVCKNKQEIIKTFF